MIKDLGRRRLVHAVGANLRRVGRVSADDWPAVLDTLVVAFVVEVGLRTMRLPRLARILGVPLSELADDVRDDTTQLAIPSAAVRRLRISAKVMRHWPFDEKCLRRSLVCGYRIRELNPSLVVGVAIVGNEVKAHAWLTVDGISLDSLGSTSFLGLVPVRRP